MTYIQRKSSTLEAVDEFPTATCPMQSLEPQMNCTICGKPIILVPSAEERAKKDLTGKSAAYYRSLFTEHSDCILRKRAEDTSKLMATSRDTSQSLGE